VDEALRRLRLAQNIQPEALVTLHSVDEANHLTGTVSVIGLLQADPELRLVDIIDSDPVRVTPSADVVDVALLMADYNLMTVPVVDADDQLSGHHRRRRARSDDPRRLATARAAGPPEPARRTSTNAARRSQTQGPKGSRDGPSGRRGSTRGGRSVTCRCPARPAAPAPASAVLDSAHLGDIEGAFGKVAIGDIGERHGCGDAC